jgi:ketosteroid isomerase-like protein
MAMTTFDFRPIRVLILALWTGVAGAAECNSLASLDWLIGEWLAEGGKTTWRESWMAISPKTWEGRGVESSKSDPRKQGSEELRIVEMGGSIFYLAKVTHNELPVPFRLIECGDGRLVFANPAHDFPRRLDYERQPDGRLHVRVSDGTDKGFTLEFARQPSAPPETAPVLAAEDARFAAMVAADAEAMRGSFAEDLAYVHSTGRVVNRAQLIDEILDGKLLYRSIKPSERQVDVMGPDAAVVRGLARIEASADGKPAEFQARYLAIYSRDGGTWRLRAWQSLRLP